MLELVWTTTALHDLKAIDLWLSEHRSPELATRRLVKLRARADFLAQFPHLGRPGAHGVRVLVVHETPYVLLYRLKKGRVEVLRIRHEREDWLLTR